MALLLELLVAILLLMPTSKIASKSTQTLARISTWISIQTLILRLSINRFNR
jgi:hypothetical protein